MPQNLVIRNKVYNTMQPSRFSDACCRRDAHEVLTSFPVMFELGNAEEWCCHCCTAKNSFERNTCRVCGRPENYALQGYGLPLHGKNSTLFRPSQVLTVLENIHEVDSEQWSSLHSACASGNFMIVKELLGFKTQIEARTNKGQTPLHLAVFSGSIDCVRELLKYSAEVNVFTSHEKATPLHIACQRQGAQIALLLVEHGADVHARNIIQRTPLHLAAETGRVDIGNLLLTHGADKDALDIHGWSARQVAELCHHRDFQELIIRESMLEKQVIIKELPPAEWHSGLWFEVSRMHNERTRQFQAVEAARKESDALLAGLAKSRQDKIIAQRREERRKEIQAYNDEKNAVREIALQYTEKLETMRRASLLQRTQEALAAASKPATPNEKTLKLQFGGRGSKPGSTAALMIGSAPPFSRQSSAAGFGTTPTLSRINTGLNNGSVPIPSSRGLGSGSPGGSKLVSRAGSSSSSLGAMDLSQGYPFPLPNRIGSAGLNVIADSQAEPGFIGNV